MGLRDLVVGEEIFLDYGENYWREEDWNPVMKRIEVYNEETTPLLGFYQQRGVLVEIPGDHSVDRVNKLIMTALDS